MRGSTEERKKNAQESLRRNEEKNIKGNLWCCLFLPLKLMDALFSKVMTMDTLAMIAHHFWPQLETNQKIVYDTRIVTKVLILMIM